MVFHFRIQIGIVLVKSSLTEFWTNYFLFRKYLGPKFLTSQINRSAASASLTAQSDEYLILLQFQRIPGIVIRV